MTAQHYSSKMSHDISLLALKRLIRAHLARSEQRLYHFLDNLSLNREQEADHMKR